MFLMWRTSPPTTHHLPVGHTTFTKFSPSFLLPPSLGTFIELGEFYLFPFLHSLKLYLKLLVITLNS